MAGKTKKARKRSRIPLSKRFKVPRKMAEDQLDRLIKDREKGIRRDFEGNIVEIGVASGGTIKKNYAHGGSVRKAKFKDS